MSFWKELQRRNVFRVAAAYVVVAWLIVQVAETILPIFEVPDVFLRGVILVLVLGFPLALFFAWAFELTPEGVKREKEVDRAFDWLDGIARGGLSDSFWKPEFDSLRDDPRWDALLGRHGLAPEQREAIDFKIEIRGRDA